MHLFNALKCNGIFMDEGKTAKFFMHFSRLSHPRLRARAWQSFQLGGLPVGKPHGWRIPEQAIPAVHDP